LAPRSPGEHRRDVSRRPNSREARIVATFKAFKSVDKYAHRATLKEIQEAEFNLNIPRYVDTFEEEEEIGGLEKDLAKVRVEIKAHLKELGLV